MQNNNYNTDEPFSDHPEPELRGQVDHDVGELLEISPDLIIGPERKT